jgi:hypothetical protein
VSEKHLSPSLVFEAYPNEAQATSNYGMRNTLNVDASTPKDDQKYVARHSSAIETPKAGVRRFVILPLLFPIKARLSKPAVCSQPSQIGKPTTGNHLPIVAKELENDGCAERKRSARWQCEGTNAESRKV